MNKINKTLASNGDLFRFFEHSNQRLNRVLFHLLEMWRWKVAKISIVTSIMINLIINFGFNGRF